MSSRRTHIAFWGIAVALGLASNTAWAGGPILGFEEAVSRPGDFSSIPPVYAKDRIKAERISRRMSEDSAPPAPWPSATQPEQEEAQPGEAETTPKVVIEEMRPHDLVMVLPPPGTLGYTYRRYSAPIPCHMHPRIGMLDVTGAPLDAFLSVEGMKGYHVGCGVWRFESVLPLFPGTPHIYRVVSKRSCDGRYVAEVRTLRLIPGRIVSLDF